MLITDEELEKIKFLTKEEADEVRLNVNEAERRKVLDNVKVILSNLEQEIRKNPSKVVSYSTSIIPYTATLHSMLEFVLKSRGYKHYSINGFNVRNSGHNNIQITVSFEEV